MLAQLVQAYQRFNLPTTLAALEVDINNRAELDRVIAHTLRRRVDSLFTGDVNPEVLRAAFEKVEYFSR
ncbi:oxidoreductase [Klebsiella pneumoniae]|uniref:Oxidoreductase n=1 Tax=Klebsiella pneumoniae TaxID=573 RepID=A0A2X3EP70_KLEPN|nr:oxidoreductase [Klebsiella pneumoniae]